MFANLIKRFFAKPEPSVLGEILSYGANREDLLGMAAPVIPTETQIHNDASRIVSYTKSVEYSVWAKEAWSEALSHMDALQNPKATMEEVNFHRGALRSTLNLLRISYKGLAAQKATEERVSSAL